MVSTDLDQAARRCARWMRLAALWLFGACTVGVAVAAGAPMRLVHRGPESAADSRRQYDWVLLREVLERTRAQAGAFELITSDSPMNSARALAELLNSKGKINILARVTSNALEQQLLPIRIPIERGLRGYRLFLIRADQQARFRAVTDLAGLQKFTFGQGKTWLDIDVLEGAGLRVEASSSYDSLFPMLLVGRFDAFPRGLDEIYPEYEVRHPSLPELAIEQNLLLYYPMPRYFFVRRDAEGEQLAHRIEAGLEMMVRDGSLKALFWRFHGDSIRRARLDRRTLLRLQNPQVPAATPLGRTELWFDPASER
jgi:ABC-type amino acid transport substrate-binding protein